MSSTGYEAANSRWRPTLPEPSRPSAATRGFGRWGVFQLGLGIAMMFFNGVLVVAGHRLVERFVLINIVFVPMLLLVAIGALISWWWTGREVRADLSGERG